MSKQVGLPKISSILQKWTSAQNPIYALFAQRPSIVIIFSKNKVFLWGLKGTEDSGRAPTR